MKEKTDEFEKDILESYENNEWQSVKNVKSEISKYQQLAKQHLKKDKRINIRISEKDLNDIQKNAVIEGLQYQTLIASIIHKHNTGQLIDKR